MSASFIFVSSKAPRWRGGAPMRLESLSGLKDQIEKRVHAAVMKMSVADVDDLVERNLSQVMDVGLDGDDETDEQWMVRMAQSLTVAVQDAIESLDKQDDFAIVQFDTWYMVTGGMSWGDTPTDSFDAIALFSELGIFEHPFAPVKP